MNQCNKGALAMRRSYGRLIFVQYLTRVPHRLSLTLVCGRMNVLLERASRALRRAEQGRERQRQVGSHCAVIVSIDRSNERTMINDPASTEWS